MEHTNYALVAVDREHKIAVYDATTKTETMQVVAYGLTEWCSYSRSMFAVEENAQ